jgi:release factor glutamine methyltransferase
MTLRAAISEALTHIAPRDAEVLLAHILGRDRVYILAHIDDPLSAELLTQLRALTARRASHEPLQYILGTQEFFGLTLRVTRDTLIPRPETELLVEAVLNWIKSQPATDSTRIIDIGTGTGAIALALAANLPTTQITAVDLSATALAIARENAVRHHLDHRIHFLESDLLTALPNQQFDIVVSNPPYVSLADASTLAPDVRDHEPPIALFGGLDGLVIVRRLIREAYKALRPGGLFAMEFGFNQRDAIELMLASGLWHSSWSNLRFLDDYACIPRVVLAERA